MEDPDDMREVSGYNFNEIKPGIRDGDWQLLINIICRRMDVLNFA